MGTDAGKVGLMKKSMYGARDAASNWERDWQEHVRNWGFQLGLNSKNLFHHKENRVSGLTYGDDFVLTGPTEKLMEFERITADYQHVEQEDALVKARNRETTLSQTR